LLDHLQIGEAAVLGYSGGALLALLFAIEHPGRLASLTLVSPAPATAAERRVFERRFAERMDSQRARTQRTQLEESDLGHTDPAGFRQQAFELSVAPYFKEPKHAVGTKRFLISARAREAVWRSLGEYDLTEDLTHLDIQALVLHGRHDPIPLESAERTASLLGSRLEVFENSGHLPQVEEYNRFVRTVDDFLPRLRS
jgi:proline iminopeptidase